MKINVNRVIWEFVSSMYSDLRDFDMFANIDLCVGVFLFAKKNVPDFLGCLIRPSA